MGRTSAADSGARREPEVRRISTDDAFAQRVHLQLEEARASGRQRRLRVSGPPLVVAVLALTCALPLLWLVASLDEEWLSSPIFWSSLLLITAALPLILVSVQPVDTRAVIATSVVSAMWLLIFSSGAALTIMFDFSVWWRLPACGTLDHLYLEFTLEAIGFVVYGAGGCQLMLLLALRCVRGARGIPAPRLLGRTWMTVGVCYVYFALAQLILSAYIFAALSLRRSGALIATVLLNDVHTACWAAFLLTPQSRQRTHAWLAERSDGVSTAAGVAAIIGGSTPQDVIRAGRRRMRAIVPSQLEHIRADSDSAHGRDGSQNAKKKGGVGAAARPPREHIFGKNVPGDNQWYQRTEPADLGGVDAFVRCEAAQHPAHAASASARGHQRPCVAASPQCCHWWLPAHSDPARTCFIRAPHAAQSQLARRARRQVGRAPAVDAHIPAHARPRASTLDRPGVSRPARDS